MLTGLSATAALWGEGDPSRCTRNVSQTLESYSPQPGPEQEPWRGFPGAATLHHSPRGLCSLQPKAVALGDLELSGPSKLAMEGGPSEKKNTTHSRSWALGIPKEEAYGIQAESFFLGFVIPGPLTLGRTQSSLALVIPGAPS